VRIDFFAAGKTYRQRVREIVQRYLAIGAPPAEANQIVEAWRREYNPKQSVFFSGLSRAKTSHSTQG